MPGYLFQAISDISLKPAVLQAVIVPSNVKECLNLASCVSIATSRGSKQD